MSLFNQIDRDGSETIIKTELENGFRKEFGMKNEDIDKLFMEADIDHSGSITKKEFEKMVNNHPELWKKYRTNRMKEQLRGVFTFGVSLTRKGEDGGPTPVIVLKAALGVIAGLISLPTTGLQGFRDEIKRGDHTEAEAPAEPVEEAGGEKTEVKKKSTKGAKKEGPKDMDPLSAAEHMSLALMMSIIMDLVGNSAFFLFSGSIVDVFLRLQKTLPFDYLFALFLHSWVVLLAVPNRNQYLIFFGQLAVVVYTGFGLYQLVTNFLYLVPPFFFLLKALTSISMIGFLEAINFGFMKPVDATSAMV